MAEQINRREATAGMLTAGLVAALAAGGAFANPDLLIRAPGEQPVPFGRDTPLFRISLAQWSLNKPLFAGEIDHLDFASEASALGCRGIEYVNAFFKDKAGDRPYLAQMNKRAADVGVEQLLIMVDGEGRLGAPTKGERERTVENHLKWLDAAATLTCRAIRVNAESEGSFDEQQGYAAEGLRALCERAEPYGLHVLVENHGGLSSHGGWLAGVMQRADHELVGTLPDFGNFCMDWSRADEPDAWYDRYKGVRELMPFAKAVSAKSYDFDAGGNETSTDYLRMMRIVSEANYRGWVGIEYEGSNLPPREGIAKTKALLERVRTELRG
ncbi:MAG: sugar phosphate isomerase/epimerase family protein [Planctomycetota bacterium]